jgi:hypothetical protein
MKWFFRMALAAFAGTAALAGPITFTLTTTATGTFAGTPFTSAAVTVTSAADTSQVFVASGTSPDLNYEVIASSSTISIAGFATATFTDPTFWYDPNGAGDIEFGDASIGNTILGFTHLFAGLETYNLTYSLGPVSSPFDFPTKVFNSFQNLPTSGGSLSLVASNDTFTAVAATSPEPATFFAVGLGLLSVLAMPSARGIVQLRRSIQHKR